MQLKVRKGDTVTILAGKDRGKTGTIERVFPKKRLVVVTGINLIKKHQSARRRATGGILTLAAPVPVSRVMVVCPHCQKPTRIAVTTDQEGRRFRACKKCKEVLTVKES